MYRTSGNEQALARVCVAWRAECLELPDLRIIELREQLGVLFRSIRRRCLHSFYCRSYKPPAPAPSSCKSGVAL